MMELPVNIVIIVVVAMVALLIILAIALLVKERGLETLEDLWNVDKWIEIIKGR